MPGRPTYTLFPYTTLFRSAFSTATSGNGAVTYYDSTGLTIGARSEEHTFELHSRVEVVWRLSPAEETTLGGGTTNGAVKLASGTTNAHTLTVSNAITTTPS